MLTNQDYEDAADEIGVEPAKIKAVDKVESNGSGFFENGEPKILFEAHWFSQFTRHKYDDSHPNISSDRWDKGLYKGGPAEHDRLSKAVDLNRQAALKSASWGRYQIMGFNWRKCDYSSLQSFINAMYRSEKDHLFAFSRFMKNGKLIEHLKNADWRAFARLYNGPRYEENNYHTRLKRAYENALMDEFHASFDDEEDWIPHVQAV